MIAESRAGKKEKRAEKKEDSTEERTESRKQRREQDLRVGYGIACAPHLLDHILALPLRRFRCYKSVTNMLQRRYAGSTRVLKGCYKVLRRVLQGCHKGVTRVLQECYKSVTRVLPPLWMRPPCGPLLVPVRNNNCVMTSL
jgi:hypothetical protein